MSCDYHKMVTVHAAWSCNGQRVRFTINRPQFQETAGLTPAVPLSCNDFGQVLHAHASVTKQYNLVLDLLCGWEGNHRPGGK